MLNLHSSHVSNDILHTIFYHSLTALLWVDARYQIVWVNPAAEQLLCMSQSKLTGLSVITLFNPPKEAHSSTQAHQIKEPFSDSHSLHHNNSFSIEAQFEHTKHSQQPLFSHDEWVMGGMGLVLLDYVITPIEQQTSISPHSQTNTHFLIEMWGKDRQARITQEQRQQEQHHIARQMIRAIAHEVKNPLAGIRGATQLLAKKLYQHFDKQTSVLPIELSQKINTYTDIIIKETDRLSHTIEQMLGSRQPLQLAFLNIHEPIEHVLSLVHSQYPTLAIVRDYDLSLPDIQADNAQLVQLFLNLCQNACEAMFEYAQDFEYQPANTPTLTLSTRIEFQFTIGNKQHKQVLKVSVQDNGKGIDPAHIEQIFFPLVTHRDNGTGLGLSIVQDIINRHGGVIDVSSMPNHTVFTVYLPFQSQHTTQC